ncbi:pentapeptide repeat protein [Methylobacterium sp. 4-46]|uniref:pentapeptide repeat-containing protein n=1 Tax=unclassified Methylobacterium TaxID=2615210 RepID=UPI000165CAC5|nr:MULTISPECIES: pentapeptide repeat-containing protein [Methylobacterium]ACA17933.1 pentapeptide repeat protein [Methylobacterium sp. 4-46]WFT77234.1 pentapeptide repeat-containing protein [Methylobacterium nodulans]
MSAPAGPGARPAAAREAPPRAEGPLDLAGAELPPGTDLVEADLSGANLARARLSGILARSARFDGARIEEADFSGADLSGAHFATVAGGQARFSGAMMEDARFCGATLRFATLAGGLLDGADFTGADLWGADFTDADADDTLFRRARLDEAKLVNVNLTGAVFEGASLAKASLAGSRLSRANFVEAKLDGADLSGADLSDARLVRLDLTSCRLRHARFAHAWLEGTRLRVDQLGGAVGEEVAGDYAAAVASYLVVERNQRSIGDREGASWAFKRARRMGRHHAGALTRAAWREGAWRAGLRHGSDWLSDRFVEWLCDYGESLTRIVRAFALAILVFAALYGVTGGLIPEGRDGVPTYNPLDLVSYSALNMMTANQPELGIKPVGRVTNILVGSQGALGIILMGLFGFVLGNRLQR